MDISNIKIQKQTGDQKFEESLRVELLENEIVSINSDIQICLKSKDLDQFLESLKKFRKIAGKYYYDTLALEIDKWVNFITANKNIDFDYFDITWNQISPIFSAMIDQANKYLSSSNKSTIESKKNSIYNKNRIESPSLSKIGVSVPPIQYKQDIDQIWQELKPVKFEGLFKKDMTSEEIVAEIKRITQENSAETQFIPKHSSISRYNKGSSQTNISDAAYPFKQDTYKLNCLIM